MDEPEEFPKPETRVPLQEVFNHDYLATCNFVLEEQYCPAVLQLVLADGRCYPLLTFAMPIFGPEGAVRKALLIDKVLIRGWIKRQAQ